MDNSFINFDYNGPTCDYLNSLQINANGTVNVKCTLQSFKILLEKNLNIINQLITKSEYISDMTAYDLNNILIIFNNKTECAKLLAEKVITDNLITEPSESIGSIGSIGSIERIDPELLTNSDNEETNNNRLTLVNNLTIQDSSLLFDMNQDVNSSSDNSDNSDGSDYSDNSDNLVDLNNLDSSCDFITYNTNAIINKYLHISNQNAINDNHTDSDSD